MTIHWKCRCGVEWDAEDGECEHRARSRSAVAQGTRPPDRAEFLLGVAAAARLLAANGIDAREYLDIDEATESEIAESLSKRLSGAATGAPRCASDDFLRGVRAAARVLACRGIDTRPYLALLGAETETEIAERLKVPAGAPRSEEGKEPTR